jgi:hypothetical protein
MDMERVNEAKVTLLAAVHFSCTQAKLDPGGEDAIMLIGNLIGADEAKSYTSPDAKKDPSVRFKLIEGAPYVLAPFTPDT